MTKEVYYTLSLRNYGTAERNWLMLFFHIGHKTTCPFSKKGRDSTKGNLPVQSPSIKRTQDESLKYCLHHPL